ALALREANADGEVPVLAVPESRQAVAQADDGRRRPPGLGQGADLNRAGWPLSRARVAAQPDAHQDDSQRQQDDSQRQATEAGTHYRAPGPGDGSASNA